LHGGVPYVFATATLVVIALVAVVSFDALGHVIGVGLSDVGFAAIEGQIVQPLLVSRRLEVKSKNFDTPYRSSRAVFAGGTPRLLRHGG